MRSARLLAGVLAAWLAGCGSAPAPPNLLLVTLDTVRADHVGAYGYARPTTPAFDALAESGTLYEHAFATAPWTLPSHASLFTGLYAFEHGAHSFLSTKGRNARPLGPEAATLAEALRDAGYDTAAFVANVAYLSRWTGLDRGFDTYEVTKGRGPKVNAAALAWLDRPRTKPFFLFVNYMDAHRPYNTAPLARLAPPPDPERGLLDELAETVLGSDAAPAPDLVAKVVAQYDHGVGNADDALGALLAALEARGVAANTVVVVTSDHGEHFGEHDLVEHSKDVYQPALRIPLVVRGAGAARGERVATPVSLAHVPRLALRALGPGAALAAERFPRAPGEEPLVAENYFSRGKDLANARWGHRFRRVRRVVVEWPWKRIVSSDGRSELYDLAADAAEANDLAAARGDVSARLDAWLAAQLAAHPPRGNPLASPKPTPEELEELRALGYVE